MNRGALCTRCGRLLGDITLRWLSEKLCTTWPSWRCGQWEPASLSWFSGETGCCGAGRLRWRIISMCHVSMQVICLLKKMLMLNLRSPQASLCVPIFILLSLPTTSTRKQRNNLSSCDVNRLYSVAYIMFYCYTPDMCGKMCCFTLSGIVVQCPCSKLGLSALQRAYRPIFHIVG